MQEILKVNERTFSQKYANLPADAPAVPTPKLLLKSGTQWHQLALDDIQSIEKEGNYATFFTAQRKVVCRLTMEQVGEILPPRGFLQVHKSYVVALAHLEVIESHQVRIGEKWIPVAKAYREALAEYLKPR